MAQSLKERHAVKRIGVLAERVKKADQQLLAETTRAQLIVEAMSQQDLDKVSAIVQKLSSIKSPELPKLSAAIGQAEAEINKYTAGGPITAAWTKMKNLVGIDNPIVKVTTFADALEKGFAQIPQILKNNGINLKSADLNKSLASTLSTSATGAKGGEGTAKSSVTGNEVPAKDDNYEVPHGPGDNSDDPIQDFSKQAAPQSGTKPGTKPGVKPSDPKVQQVPDKPQQPKKPVKPTAYRGDRPTEEPWAAAEGVEHDLDEADDASSKLKAVAAQLQKALSPGGIFGVFKKVPYINSAELSQELLQAPLRVFSNVVKKINSGAKAAEVAPDLKDTVTDQGAAETKGTQQGEPTQQPSQSQPSQPAKPSVDPTDSTPSGESTPQPQGGGAPDNFAAAKQKVIDLVQKLKKNPGRIDAFVKKLVDAGLDHTKL